jgi:hypothetical protein
MSVPGTKQTSRSVAAKSAYDPSQTSPKVAFEERFPVVPYNDVRSGTVSANAKSVCFD